MDQIGTASAHVARPGSGTGEESAAKTHDVQTVSARSHPMRLPIIGCGS
jgi:hypothetical protein